MNFKVQRINIKNATSNGNTLKNTVLNGEVGANFTFDKWTRNAGFFTLDNLEKNWNEILVPLLKPVALLYDKYNLNNNVFDSRKLFYNLSDEEDIDEVLFRPSVTYEKLFNLNTRLELLQSSFNTLNSQLSRKASGDVIDSFLLLEDTPSSYIGEANKFVGVQAGGTSIEFFQPSSTANLLSLSDTFNSYISEGIPFSSATDQLDIVPKENLTSWEIQRLAAGTDFTLIPLADTQCDNVMYLIDIGVTPGVNNYSISLGQAFPGSRVGFKVVSGDATSTTKNIIPQVGVTLMAGTTDFFQLDSDKAYCFVYDETLTSYFLVEEY